MRRPSLLTLALLAVAHATVTFSIVAQSQKQTDANAAQKYFTDVELVNQDNKTVRLYSDLLKDKVVVINSFFATEHPACTAMFQSLVRVQRALGDRAKDVAFISITVDPGVDTPAHLKTFAQRFNATSGWLFITGQKENVDLALRKLGMAAAAREDHSMVLIVGNERTGLWKKALAMGKPDEVAKIISDTLDNK